MVRENLSFIKLCIILVVALLGKWHAKEWEPEVSDGATTINLPAQSAVSESVGNGS